MWQLKSKNGECSLLDKGKSQSWAPVTARWLGLLCPANTTEQSQSEAPCLSIPHCWTELRYQRHDRGYLCSITQQLPALGSKVHALSGCTPGALCIWARVCPELQHFQGQRETPVCTHFGILFQRGWYMAMSIPWTLHTYLRRIGKTSYLLQEKEAEATQSCNQGLDVGILVPSPGSST